MKPTVRVSIGKTAFTLEEEAYLKLKAYLDTLQDHFQDKASGKEILEEIESRIAELLLEKCGPQGVATTAMVEEILNTLGSVDDIDADKESGKESANESDNKSSNADSTDDKQKKLYRDLSNRVLGGVCSGMAAYFNREPALFRFIAVIILLFFIFTAHGFGLWIPAVLYVLLWICIPPARTVRQRYRMRGESINLDNIMQNVRNGAKEIEDTAVDFNNRHPGFWRSFARAFAIVFGGLFILLSAAGLLTLLIFVLGSSIMLPLSVTTMVSSIVGPGASVLYTVLLCAVTGIPFIGMLYTGILLCFDMKAPRWRPGLIMFLVWLLSAVGLAYLTVRTAIEYDNSDRHEVTTEQVLGSDRMEIVMEGSDMDYNYIYLDADKRFMKLVLIKDEDIYVYPQIRLRTAAGDAAKEPKAVIDCEATYFNRKAPEPDFYSYSDGVLTLRPHVIRAGEKIEEAGREITLTVPEGTDISVSSPKGHDFSGTQYYTNISMLKRNRTRFRH